MKVDKTRKDSYKYITECSSCASVANCMKFEQYETEVPKGIYYLCEICAKSFISSGFFYPTQQNNGDVLRAVGYIANELKKEIAKLRKERRKLRKAHDEK